MTMLLLEREREKEIEAPTTATAIEEKRRRTYSPSMIYTPQQVVGVTQFDLNTLMQTMFTVLILVVIMQLFMGIIKQFTKRETV